MESKLNIYGMDTSRYHSVAEAPLAATEALLLLTDTPPVTPPSISMDSLYPTLIQCFAIIICGYLAGRLNIVTNAESKGLNTFVGTFALPSLIFLSLVELDWRSVNWNFLVSILISKAVVFLAVIAIALLVIRPKNYGKAGILAIFCTQSNDFAIGFPLVNALYGKTHPEYAAFLYLMAPISLAILNPIGIILMEVSKLKSRNRQNSIANGLEGVSTTTTAGNTLSPTTATRTSIVAMQCAMRTSTGAADRRRLRCFELKGTKLMIFKFVKSMFVNPILMMTILGVIGGFSFPHGLPEIIAGILRTLGNSFSATALFLLGLRMVGNAAKLQGPTLILPGILILVKLLVLPITIRQTVNVMGAGANATETTDLGTFGFLYGTLPAAPGVYVIASQYNMEMDLVATSMVACTFISAPLMMISAKMITLTNLNPKDYLNELSVVAFDLSVAAILGAVSMLALFTITKRIRRMPHKVTSCLLLTQLIGSTGVLMWTLGDEAPAWAKYLQFALYSIGTYGSRLWTACLAVTLLFLQCRSLCFVLRLWPYFVTIGWALPVLIVAVLMICDPTSLAPDEKRNPSFQYGNAQAAIAIFILVMCFIVTVGCLVLHQRYRKRHEKYVSLSRDVEDSSNQQQQQQQNSLDATTPEDDSTMSTTTVTVQENPTGPDAGNVLERGTPTNGSRRRKFTRPVKLSSTDLMDLETPPPSAALSGGGGGCEVLVNQCCSSDQGGSCGGGGSGIGSGNAVKSSKSTEIDPKPRKVVDIEDLVGRPDGPLCDLESPSGASANLCSSQFDCGSSRDACQSRVEDYRAMATADALEPADVEWEAYNYQVTKHTVLLILLLCSMFVGLALSIWTLVLEGMSGIYIELAFLDAFLNYGQSLVVLAVFIGDIWELLMPLSRLWRNVWSGAGSALSLPAWEDLDDETRLMCERFVNHHLGNCRLAIACDRRWRIRVYRNCFHGGQFVDWLVDVGLANDRVEAVKYAKKLVDGRVLRHITNRHHFYDKTYLYTFCERL